jgi:hypothetical protein
MLDLERRRTQSLALLADGIRESVSSDVNGFRRHFRVVESLILSLPPSGEASIAAPPFARAEPVAPF